MSSNSACECGSQQLIFKKFANTWEISCNRCSHVFFSNIPEHVKKKMEIAMKLTTQEIEKNFPKNKEELLKIKIDLENIGFMIKNG